MSEDNPWKTLSQKVMYENPWITVREDQVIRPDGESGIYGVVETRVATGVVALDSQERVTLVGQYRYTTENYSWEIVEGGAEDGEAPLDAAKRELREETGLSAKTWQSLGGVVHLSNCHSSETAHFFLAEDLVEGVAEPEGTEVLQVKQLHFTECMEMVHAGSITDAMSIIALERLDRILRERKMSNK
jgi:8-oxo-dGTP pyrophosphatase MutT (NUDIX family)